MCIYIYIYPYPSLHSGGGPRSRRSGWEECAQIPQNITNCDKTLQVVTKCENAVSSHILLVTLSVLL